VMIEHFAKGVLRLLDFPVDLPVGQGIQFEMVEGVVANLVAFGEDALGEFLRGDNPFCRS